jgi:hypothetical protein
MTAPLAPVRDALQAADRALTAQLGAKDARIADLEAQLAALRPATLTLGLNTTSWAADAVAAQRTMLGDRPLSNIRVFFSPGEAPSWNDNHLAVLRPADRPFISCKTLSEQSLRAFLDAMPDAYQVEGARYRLCFQHEGEADILGGGDPAGGLSTYLGTYAMIQRVLAGHENGRFFEPWKILLYFTQVLDGRPGHRDSWPQFVGDQDVPVGMDCYWPPNHPDYDPPEDLFGKLLEIHEKTQLRVCVPEWGGVTSSPKRTDTDGSRRAVAIRRGIEFLRTTPIEAASWWNGTGAAGDHRLDPFPSNVAAWADGMAGNPTA